MQETLYNHISKKCKRVLFLRAFFEGGYPIYIYIYIYIDTSLYEFNTIKKYRLYEVPVTTMLYCVTT